MSRKSKISKSFCKLIIFVCITAILYSLARSFLFPTREGISPPVTILTDFVTGAKNALESIFGKVKIDGKWVGIGANNPPTDIEVDDDGNILATVKTTGAKGRGHFNGDKIENFQWLNQNGEPSGPVYSATLKLDHNKKVSVIPWESGGRGTGSWIREAPQIDKPYCQFNVLNECKTYPDVPKLGWFKDQDHGGPKPTTEAACEARRQSWIGSCGNQNVSMAWGGVDLESIKKFVGKKVHIQSVSSNRYLRATYCWMDQPPGQNAKCGLATSTGEFYKDEEQWIIKSIGENKYNITSVSGQAKNHMIYTPYCWSGADKYGYVCKPAMWGGNDKDVNGKWTFSYQGGDVFEIINFTNKNLSIENGKPKMGGKGKDIQWKITLV